MDRRTRKNLRHKIVSVSLCFLLALMHTSCNKKEIYYRFHEIKDAEWAQKDTLSFDIDSTLYELNIPYQVSIEVTNNVNYPYQNIWFFIQTNLDNDSTFTNTSREFLLADEFGKWQGSGFGNLFQVSLPLDDIVFRKRRNYLFKIEHGMRDNPLTGIEKVGIKISKK